MQQWEYTVVNLEIDNWGQQRWSDTIGQYKRADQHRSWVPLLNELGEEGWELSGIVTLSAQRSRFVFKRQRQ